MKQSKSEFWSGEEYDAQYADSYSHEIALLQQIAIELNAKSLLDVCCGTGIVTIPLAKNFTQSVGIDFSIPMLSWAKQKSKDSVGIEFLEMDATSFDFGSEFDLICMTGNAFQAFISDHDLTSVLSNIRAHMHKDSLFIFDTRLSGLTRAPVSSQFEHWDCYDSSRGVEVNVYGKSSPHHSLNDVTVFDIRREYQDGERYDSRIELKFRSLDEINHYLAKSHLRIKYCYSNWQRSSYEDGVNNCVCVIQPI